MSYTRIVGEMTKLGIRISRRTVRNNLREENIEPGPERKSEVWSDFLNRHRETLWACGFMSVRTITATGLRKMYVLVFLCVKTHEVYVTTSTQHPKSAWVSEQTSLFLESTANREKKPALVLHDRDTKFCKKFVQALKDGEAKPVPLPVTAPNLNRRCERFIGTLERECLHHFLIFGRSHLDYLVKEFGEYNNRHRPHSSCEYLPQIQEIP